MSIPSDRTVTNSLGRWLLLLCLGLGLALCRTGWAVDAFAVAPDRAEQSMRPVPVPAALEQVQVFEDVSARMRLDDILSLPTGRSGGFLPLGASGTKPGFSRSAWWLRAVVSNRVAAAAIYVLAFPEPRLEYVD